MEDSKAYIRRLLTEKLTGMISDEDAITIDQLIATDTQVQQDWLTMKEKLDRATANGTFSEPDADAAWQQLRPALTRPKKNYTFKIIAAAACLTAVIATHYIFAGKSEKQTDFFAQTAHWPSDSILLQIDNGPAINLSAGTAKNITAGMAQLAVTDSTLLVAANGKIDQPQWSIVLVPPAQRYKLRLSDGSDVWLNAGTRLRFPLHFTGNQREVYIDGEAYFKVATNAQQPFVVHTVKTNVTVLGTQFNVNTYDTADIKTSLVEGAVSTSCATGSFVLKPGMESVYRSHSFTTNSFDASLTLSWLEDTYYFHDTPLKSLAGIMSRWFKMQVQFDTPTLENKVFSGALLRQQPVQVFLENLEASDNIHATVRNNVVHFTGK